MVRLPGWMYACLMVLAVLFLSSCLMEGEPQPKVIGPQIVDEQGNPVAGARVYITPADNIPFRGSGSETELLGSGSETTFNGSGSETTLTNDDGRYSLGGLKDGDYNIEAYKDGKISFRSSVNVSDEERLKKQRDTLRTPGKLEAKVVLLPEDDLRTVFVFILGTSHLTMPDSNGVFAFPDLGKGKYNLRILSTLDSYEVWDSEELEIKSGKKVDLGEIYLPHKTELNMKITDLTGQGKKIIEFENPVYGIDFYSGNFFQVDLNGNFIQYDLEAKVINQWNIGTALDDIYKTNVVKVLGKDSLLVVDENYDFTIFSFEGDEVSKFNIPVDFYNISVFNRHLLLTDLFSSKIYEYDLNGNLFETYSEKDKKGTPFGALWGSVYNSNGLYVLEKSGVDSKANLIHYNDDFEMISEITLPFQSSEWLRISANNEEVIVLGSNFAYVIDEADSIKHKIKLYDGLSLNTKTHTGVSLPGSNQIAVYDETGFVELFEY